MGGSMGSVVGERFVRGVQTAIEQKVPFICITSTGGARMQEGLLSLLQMAKTTAMIARLADAKLPFISVLADPTMGGVSASFAFMGDVVIAEPKALIGFAGPRVIEQTVREKLPEGFQRSEFLLTKGAIDMIVDRRQMRDEIAMSLALLLKQPADAIELVQGAGRCAPATITCLTAWNPGLLASNGCMPSRSISDLTACASRQSARPATRRSNHCRRRYQRQGLDMRDAGFDLARGWLSSRPLHIAASCCGSMSALAIDGADASDGALIEPVRRGRASARGIPR